MVIIIIWMLLGLCGLIENAEVIAEVEDKKMKVLGMLMIILSTPFYSLTNVFDYILEQIFGDCWKDDDDENNRFC